MQNRVGTRYVVMLIAQMAHKRFLTFSAVGGNAVLGYHQNFDMEGDSGIVVRWVI